MVVLPWTYFGRGRGLLALLGLAGLAAFFGPWVVETAPNLRTYSAFDMGLKLRWMWAAGIAFLVMVPIVLSRRTVFAMRGSRFAVGFLAAIALMTVIVRIASPQASSGLVPVRYEWGFGLYASGVIALLTIAAATRFGGDLKDLPIPQKK